MEYRPEELNIPSHGSLMKIVQRQRKGAEKDPGDLNFDLRNCDEILEDLRIGEDRYIEFGRSEMCLIDGTFKSCLSLLSRIYSIHGMLEDVSFKCIFILMKNRTENFCRQIFEALRLFAREKEIDLNPRLILTDFEQGAINASKYVFRSERHCGCSFQLSQSLYRHVQKEGLASLYQSDASFAQSIRNIVALAFLRQSEIYQQFEQIKGSIS